MPKSQNQDSARASRPVDQSSWLSSLIENLERSGPEAAAALQFMRRRRTRLGVHDQPTGARWTIDRQIQIHPRFLELSPDDPYALSLVIHEVRHLQQGFLTALSVYGELDAWRLQFSYLKSHLGRFHADPRRNSIIEELMLLPLGWDRNVLAQARTLMRAYAGKRYRVDLLPLYPLHAEALFWIAHRQPSLSREDAP